MTVVARFGRVELHALAPTHQDLYCDVFTCPAVMTWVFAPLTRERASASFEQALRDAETRERCEGIWPILCDGTAVGLMGLQPCEQPRTGELGTLLLPMYQGAGIALDAVEATVDLAFRSEDWDALLVRHKRENRGAASVMRRVRMQVQPIEEVEVNRITWRLLKSEWPGFAAGTPATQAQAR